MPTVRSIAGRTLVETAKVKGSRFVGAACPVGSIVDVQTSLSEHAALHAGASHHAWAYRLSGAVHPDGSMGPAVERAWDDGEPRGTAGEPLLRRLIGEELLGVLLIATRWFGGTKLGKGGLVRAYGDAGRMALEAATVVEQVVCATVSVTVRFADDGGVRSVLHGADLGDGQADYLAEGVRRVVAVPVESVADVVHAVTERTAGRAQVEVVWPGQVRAG